MTEWQPIEKYKKGRAVFYCPPTINQRHSSNNQAEYYTFERPQHRTPTHFMQLTAPLEQST